ncbi:MAG: D-alanyl-D-alanine carboxypeptidase family protein [Methylophilaceae bacterium]|jgi:D-alanyl-D-alanine carboxypeptidase (penicillin-binding protein 5/6)|nr:D-alanyl-D-alanine carboxypeptidase [Methylophilaceae bacterium]
MRQHLIILIASLLLPLFSWAAAAPPPPLEVSAYLLKDFNSGSVIAAHKAGEKLEPASLTKIMTAYLTFDALRQGYITLTQNVPVSKKAWKAEGSRMFIEPKRNVTVDELLHGLIIQSGNDAAIALAEVIGGSEGQFAKMMNQQATKIGMDHTNYVNATGLPDKKHYTTASDLALMAEALIRDFPEDYDRLYKQKEYTYNKITQPNRNRLLWLDSNVDGMKTGHTEAAGYCLVSSAKRDRTRLIAIILGAKSKAMRASESQRLLNYGFQFYESTLVYKKSQTIVNMSVYKGAEKTVSATVKNDLSLSLPKGDYTNVKATTTAKQPLIAPIKAGQEIGTITFSLDNKVIAERPLVAAAEVVEAGFLGSIIDRIKLLLNRYRHDKF